MSEEICSMNKIHPALSRRFCCYKGCSSDQLKTRNGAISFFGFPLKDTERCSIWITNCGREEFRFLTPRELRQKRVCELHFHPYMFTNDFRNNLVKHAVPVVYEEPCIDETITINDDDDDYIQEDLSDEGIVSDTSSNNNSSSENDQANNSLNLENEPHSTTQEQLRMVTQHLTSNQFEFETGESSTNIEGQVLSRDNNNLLIEEVNTAQEPLLVEKKSSVTKPDSMNVAASSKHSLKTNQGVKSNTKFHNLPPQTTQSDFYFQQCPGAEETNSFSEPPDGELPLFVQQDSIVSMADDQANSEISEPPYKKRKRDKDNDELANGMRDTMKHLRNVTALLSKNDDEFELFGKSVALQLKKMSICTALAVQAKIQNLLSDYRINEIRNKNKELLSENTVDSGKVRNDQKVTFEEPRLLPPSPQLSLTCDQSESENETTEIG